ncbi:MAG: hypothetical protein E6Q97_36980 [Desulfurellales bacterium]|nr:MAG: hypothetical protein E6Q97_36980 [Desulfurellales bacterium]
MGFYNAIDQNYVSVNYTKPPLKHRKNGHKGYIRLGIESENGNETVDLTVEGAAKIISLLSSAIQSYQKANGQAIH